MQDLFLAWLIKLLVNFKFIFHWNSKVYKEGPERQLKAWCTNLYPDCCTILHCTQCCTQVFLKQILLCIHPPRWRLWRWWWAGEDGDDDDANDDEDDDDFEFHPDVKLDALSPFEIAGCAKFCQTFELLMAPTMTRTMMMMMMKMMMRMMMMMMMMKRSLLRLTV